MYGILRSIFVSLSVFAAVLSVHAIADGEYYPVDNGVTSPYKVIDGVAYSLYWDNDNINDQGVPDYYIYATIVDGENIPEILQIPSSVYFQGLQDPYFTNVWHFQGEYPVRDINFQDSKDYPANIKSLYIPESVKSILISCPSLENYFVDQNNPFFSSANGLLLDKSGKTLIAIPGSMESASVPWGVTTIGSSYDAEQKCTKPLCEISPSWWPVVPKLSSVNLPATVTTIYKKAFDGCAKLSKINLPESLHTIMDGAFSNCENLNEIILPNSLLSIGYHCFYNSSIQSLTIPKNVCDISSRAFERCDLLSSITVNKDNQYFTSIDGVLYSKDGKTLLSFPPGHSTEHTIAMGTEIIGPYAFAENRILEKVIFPKSLRSVGEYAFSGCFKIKSGSVVFNEGLESIEPYAFQSCRIQKISLPSTLKNIGTRALTLCSWKKLVCKAVNPPICEKEAIYYRYNDYSNRKVVVPVKSIAKYKNSPEWEKLPIGSAFSTVNHLKIKDNPKYVYQNEVVIADESMDGVKWTTSNPDIAYVNESGLVVSMGRIGNCVLSLMYEDEVVDSILFEATEPGTTANVPAQVAHSSADNTTTQKVVIDGISSDNSMLNVHLEPALRADNLTWSSSDESVATIDHGIISFKDSSKNVTFTVEDRAGNVASYEYSGEASSISDFSEGTINPEDSRETQLYNLNGIPVTNPSPGVYIRKKGSDISKVLIK